MAFKQSAPVEVFWLLSVAGAQISWADCDHVFLQAFFLSKGNSLPSLKRPWFDFLTSSSDYRFALLQALIESFPAEERTGVAKTIADMQYGGVRCMGAITDDKCQQYLRDLVYFCGRYQLEEGPPVHISATSIVVRAKDHRIPSITEAFEATVISDPTHATDALTYSTFLAAILLLTGEASVVTLDIFHDLFESENQRCDLPAFSSYCVEEFGDLSAVAIKFMSSEGQFRQELQQQELRRHGPQYVVSLLCHSESVELMGRWQHEVGTLPVLSLGSAGSMSYKYGVVMHAGDRNLQAIFNYENPGIDAIKVIARQVLEALSYIHGRDVMHGDIKMLNVTRFSHDNRLRLIGFDASCPIDSTASYAGAKFSSSCVPPAMLHRFESATEIDKFNAYWQQSGIKYDSEESKAAWLEKIAPRQYKQYSYCVKTFSTQVPDQSGLPYSPVLASPSIDIWSVGVMLYQLATAQSLVKIDRYDDIASGEGYQVIYDWSEAVCQSKLLKVKDLALRDILSKMLSLNPIHRRSAGDLLNHPFFLTAELTNTDLNLKILTSINEIKASQILVEEQLERIDAKLVHIEGLTLSLRGELVQGFDTMKRYIKATAEVTVPTLFIITPVRDVSFYTNLKREATTTTTATTSTDANMTLSVKSKLFFSNISHFYDCILKFAADPAKPFLSLIEDDYEMHLLCELCYERMVTPDIWPVPINKRKDGIIKVLHSLLPLARTGLAVAKVVNGVTGVARMLGYPVPTLTLPVDTIDLSIFTKDSSLHDFINLEQSLFDAAKNSGEVDNNEQLEGYSQREFKRFLSVVDPKDDWGKLKRILLEKGCAMWCCPRCCHILQTNPKVSYKDLRASVGNPVPIAVEAADERTEPAPVPSVQTASTPPAPSLPHINDDQPIHIPSTIPNSTISSTPPATHDDILQVKEMLSTLLTSTSSQQPSSLSLTDKLIRVEQKVDNLTTILSSRHQCQCLLS